MSKHSKQDAQEAVPQVTQPAVHVRVQSLDMYAFERGLSASKVAGIKAWMQFHNLHQWNTPAGWQNVIKQYDNRVVT